MFKNRYNAAKAFIRRNADKAAIVEGTTLATAKAFAEDTGIAAAAKTGIDNAASQGTTVGGYVVAAVAGMVVVGVIIGLVKKL